MDQPSPATTPAGPGAVSDGPSGRGSELRTIAVGGAAGTALEWYDFALFGALAASVFPKVFFTSASPTVGLLASFAGFGVGLLARPIGGVVCGHIGDRVGRKPVLVATIVLMGACSVLMGLLPGYDTIGVAAPILLVVLRTLQGFALGGESSGAPLIATEYAPLGQRGRYAALVNVGSPLGTSLAFGTILLLNAVMTPEQFIAWGWRIPFVCSALLVVVGVIIRRRLSETPAFKKAVEEDRRASVPLVDAVRHYPATIIRLFLIWLVVPVVGFLILTFTSSYLTREVGLSSQAATAMLFLSTLAYTGFVYLGGTMSDRFGRRPVLFTGSITIIVLSAAYFPLLQSRIWVVMFLAILLLGGAIYLVLGVMGPLFAEPFPTEMRFSCSTLIYGGTQALGGAPAPAVAVLLLQASGGSPWSIAVIMVGLGVAQIVAIAFHPETRDVALAGVGHPEVDSTAGEQPS